MHPVPSIIHAGELRQQELLATAFHAERCALATGRPLRPDFGATAWALSIVMAAIALIAAVAGGDPATIAEALTVGR